MTRPSGTVTFLFTDIEGSTKLALEHPGAWENLRARHNSILRAAIESNHGYVFQIIGDAFCAAFATAMDGLRAALEAQRSLQTENWGDTPVRVRMGLHTGQAELQENGDYHGYLSMSRVQRLISAGHGGQVLVSQATQNLVCDELPANVTLLDLGQHRLKDLVHPEHIFQATAPGLAATFASLKTLDAYRHNLPAQMTSFIGREKEITEVKQALMKQRLVTLTGSGGSGKTRLSLQVAAELLDLFPNGIWFVELAPITDPDLIPQTILSTAEMQTHPGRSALDTLLDFLREKTALLVLDTCEHLIEACARLADTLLRAAPNLKILASSREALGMPGELAWRVPSLSVPDLKHLPSFDTLLQYESVRLFIDRALLVQPHFAVTNENAPAVAQVCSRLDGIPLAIELAAARIRMMSAEQIAARLDDRFRLLTGGSRTALPRQQTLRALMDWSYELLSENERTLLRRLAVFMGGWTLELAEQVCSDEKMELYEVMDMLGHLVDKSLVTTSAGGAETRYQMLETVRQYAREKLFESGEGEAMRDRHLKAFLDLAEKAEPEIQSANQLVWLNRLEDEIENLRAALEWAREHDQASCLRLANALWRFWGIRHSQEGMEQFLAILPLTDDMRTVARARALSRASHLAVNTMDSKHAELFANEAYALGMELNDKPSMARALLELGILKVMHYQEQSSVDLLNRSLKLAEEIGDHGLVASALRFLGFQLREHDLPSSIHFLEQSIEEARLSGDRRLISYNLRTLAVNKLAQSDAAHAIILLHEALLLTQEINDQENAIGNYGSLSLVGLFLEDYEYAEDQASQAFQIAETINFRGYQIEALTNLMFVAWAQGNILRLKDLSQAITALAKRTGEPAYIADALWIYGELRLLESAFAEAESALKESLTIYRNENIISGYCNCLEALAFVAIANGQHGRGARLLGAREKISESTFSLNFPFRTRQLKNSISIVCNRLGEESFNQAWAEGRAMTMEQAIAYALEEIT